jgi:hypothetical protein
MDIVIDVSSVPEHRRNDPRLLQLRNEMQAAMSNPTFLDALCIHEAAHLEYAVRFNVPVTNHQCPRIEYDSDRDNFDGYPFALTMDVINEEATKLDKRQILQTRALISASGGVAARELKGVIDGGDEGDMEILNQVCDAVGLPLVEERIGLWRWAQDKVREELQIPELRQKILLLAEQIKLLLGSCQQS